MKKNTSDIQHHFSVRSPVDDEVKKGENVKKVWQTQSESNREQKELLAWKKVKKKS